MHMCANGVCNEEECCGYRCNSFTGTCPPNHSRRSEHDGHTFTGTCDPGTEERRDAEDGHRFYGYHNMHNECCVKTCGKNFKGVCPMGTIQRSQDDFHDCTKTMGEKCGVDECCGKNCHTEFFLKNGQCPPGTRPRSKYDFHTPPRGTYDAEECCREPSKCEKGIKAPAGTTHTCDDAPTSCEEARSLICGNGCYSECWRLGQSYEHKQGTVEMFCASTGYTADTVCDGFTPLPSPSPSPHISDCKNDKCCGTATIFKDGKCVPSYHDMCKNGNNLGLNWVCESFAKTTSTCTSGMDR